MTRPPNPAADAISATRIPRGARQSLEARIDGKWIVIAYACGADGDPDAREATTRFLEESVVAKREDKRAVAL
jgi:hypothetical protein